MVSIYTCKWKSKSGNPFIEGSPFIKGFICHGSDLHENGWSFLKKRFAWDYFEIQRHFSFEHRPFVDFRCLREHLYVMGAIFMKMAVSILKTRFAQHISKCKIKLKTKRTIW